MPKKTGSTYKARYNAKWESEPTLKDWIRSIPGVSTKAECPYCKKSMRAHHSHLIKHAMSETHRICVQGRESNAVRFFKAPDSPATIKDGIPNDRKVSDLRISAAIACHASINSIDYVREINEYMKGCIYSRSPVGELKPNRIKCTNLIQNVLGPELKRKLIEDIGSNPYSLIVNESNDQTLGKQLDLVIRYYHKSEKEIISTFLGMLHIEKTSANAQTVTDTICKFMEETGLALDKCVGLGTTSADVPYDTKNSMATNFQKINPSLVEMRCVCHSLQLAASRAAETLPTKVDFLVYHTYNWFTCYTGRQRQYKSIYKTINNGTQPLKIRAPPETRWSSIFHYVKCILSHWQELQLHFKMAKSKERCLSADFLHQMYEDPSVKLYMEFLKPVLGEFNRLIKLFQSESASYLKLFADLEQFLRTLVKRTVKTNIIQLHKSTIDIDFHDESIFLSPADTDLGISFNQHFEKEIADVQQKADVRLCCTIFLREACKQAAKSVPDTLKLLNVLSKLSPKTVTSAVKPPVKELPFVNTHFRGDLACLEKEWRQVNLVDWGPLVYKEPVDFWSAVAEYTDEAGARAFQKLSHFAMKMMTIPISYGYAERVFNHIKMIRTDQHNAMNREMLSSILYVRCALGCLGEDENECKCEYFVPTPGMLRAVQDREFYCDAE